MCVLEPHPGMHRPQTVLHVSLALYLGTFEVMDKACLISTMWKVSAYKRVSQASLYIPQNPFTFRVELHYFRPVQHAIDLQTGVCHDSL